MNGSIPRGGTKIGCAGTKIGHAATMIGRAALGPAALAALGLAAGCGGAGAGSSGRPVTVGVERPGYAEPIAAGRMFLDRLEAIWAVPGISVAVGVGDGIVWSEARGFAELETGRPLLPSTPLRIHSVSKPVTALAIGRLIDRGLLDVDAPIRSYVPGWPAEKDGLSIRLLGAHLGGVRHYGTDEEVHNRRRYRTALESLEAFAADSLLHPPGTRYAYSSYGWNLIGAALESVCGVPFPTCMERWVFEPLGMRHTYLDGTRSGTPEARYYELTSEGLEPAPAMDLSNRWPGGGIVSTPEDLVRFGLAFLDGALSERTRALLLTRQVTSAGDTIPHGIGWDLGAGPGGGVVAHHRGGSTGGMSYLALLPEHRFAFAIVLNVNGDLGPAPPPVEEALAALESFLAAGR